MPSIKIKVGAALNPNALTVFTPLEKAAEKARANIQKSANAGATATERAAKKAADTEAKEAQRAAKEVIAAMKKADRATEQAWAAGERAAAKAAKAAEREAQKAAAAVAKAKQQEVRAVEKAARERVRLEQQAAREIERMLAKENAAKERDSRRKSGRWYIGDNFYVRKPYMRTLEADPVRGAANLARGAVGFGRRVAMDMVHGMGVNTDLASMVSANQSLESSAVQLSNSAYQPGDKLNGQRVDPRALIADVRRVSTANGMNAGDTMEGLRAFVGKTGDLQTGRDALSDLARLSKATGTNMEDMVEAAADVSIQLGDVPNKGQAVAQIMRTVAGQGKLGAIEIKDMATQMAKLASSANEFEGDKAHNIATMGALAQAARQRGGASSATMAATSAANFAGDLLKKTNLKNMQAAGIRVFADDAHTKVRDPQEIIMEALTKTHGDLGKLATLFPNKQGFRSVKGFADIYNETGGTDAQKLAAVNDEFKRLRDTAMGLGEVNESFKAAMATSESQVQVFNNKLSEVAEQLSGHVNPALTALAPLVLKGVEAFSKWVGDVTGVAQSKKDTQEVENDIAINNRTSRFHAAISDAVEDASTPAALRRNHGPAEIDEGLVTQNKADIEALQKAIEAKKAELNKSGEDEYVIHGKDGSSVSRKLKDMSPQELAAVRTEYGDASSDRFAVGQKQLDSLNTSLNRAQTEQNRLLLAIQTGTLKVHVVNASDIAVTPPTSFDNPLGGRMPADSPSSPVGRPGPWR